MDEVRIDFGALASLRKWPSLNKERITDLEYPGPYLLLDGPLNECIRQFISKPKTQHHLYEIYTAPQPSLVSAVLSAEHVAELARLQDLL